MTTRYTLFVSVTAGPSWADDCNRRHNCGASCLQCGGLTERADVRMKERRLLVNMNMRHRDPIGLGL